MSLQGRGVLITGASRGFGKAVARACVEAGADVFLCARGIGELEEHCRSLRADARPDQRVLFQAADISDPESASRLVRAASEQLPRFIGLVNNAGIYGPKGRVEEVAWKEWVRAIEVNLFGTVLLCRAAIPVFRRQAYGKIVNLSGGGATAPMPRLSAYAASKAAVVRLTETLAHETSDGGIDINAVAPGALNTRMLEEVLAAGPEKVGQALFDKAVQQKASGGAPPEKGASLCAFLLSAASDGITGRLLSAIWDPWLELPARAAELRESDIYTLRRIVPKDRGLRWD
ncbi:MAG: SDR family oxidoreductase [Acidobacteriia bacterium]|nr:SDR family oxidoreductase [Terriglobia bacterium]